MGLNMAKIGKNWGFRPLSKKLFYEVTSSQGFCLIRRTFRADSLMGLEGIFLGPRWAKIELLIEESDGDCAIPDALSGLL